MEKTIYSADYRRFLQILREARQTAGLTQEEVARRLRQTQSFVSKCERGERRLDIVEVRRFCLAIGLDFPRFMAHIHKTLGATR